MVNFDLSDCLVDLVNENIDCVICIGELIDFSLISVCFGEMCCMVVVSLVYLVVYGVLWELVDLIGYNCLLFGQQCGWVFCDLQGGVVDMFKVGGMFECNDGVVLYEWVLVGCGLVWCLLWEVGQDLKEGCLMLVFDVWQVLLMGIYVVFLQC